MTQKLTTTMPTTVQPTPQGLATTDIVSLPSSTENITGSTNERIFIDTQKCLDFQSVFVIFIFLCFSKPRLYKNTGQELPHTAYNIKTRTMLGRPSISRLKAHKTQCK